MTLGQTIKYLRKQNKLTIKVLSQKSGLSIVSISNYENDRCKPNLVSLKKLSEALKCKYETLFNLR